MRGDRARSILMLLVTSLQAACGAPDGGPPDKVPPYDAGGGGAGGAGGTGGAGGSGGGFDCAQGRCDCDRQRDNGFEISINDDPDNCGACRRACPAAPYSAPSCNSGVCGLVCDIGFADCDLEDGCETDLDTDARHCGACHRLCNPAPSHGRSECVDGTCRVECAREFADCDLDDSNGCEVDLDADPDNCGRCGYRCPLVPSAAICKRGLCELTCPTGRADCNVDIRDGCEIDTTADRQNCGACGVVCANGPCVDGHCSGG